MADIRIKDLPLGTAAANKFLPMDLTTTERASVRDIVLAGRPSASQAEAEAGNQPEKAMTPLLTKQAINKQVSLAGRTGDYNDLLNRPDASSVRQIPFNVSLGQTSVVIPEGYDIGTVYQVFLNGVLLDTTAWSAVDGTNVTFPAIISLDIVDGESFASLVVVIGATSFMEPNWDARYQLRYARSVREFGVVGDGVADDTDAIIIAATSGSALLWPEGTYRTTRGIEFETPQRWSSGGLVYFKYDAPVGSLVEVQLWFKDYVYAQGEFYVDHNATAGNYVEPEPNPGGFVKPHGNAVIVSGDYSLLDGWGGTDSFDNLITIGAYNETTWAGIPGKPLGAIVTNGRSYRCGQGIHGTAVSGFSGKLGGSVSIASGKACIVSNWFDRESSQGFVHDVGAGGSGTWVNCISWNAKKDPVNGTGGTAWYVGTGDSQFINCGAVFPDVDGWNIDSPAINNDYVNCYSNISGGAALRTNAGTSTWTAFSAGSAWQGGGPDDAIIIDTGGAGGTGGVRDVYGLTFIAPRVTGTANVRYGLACAGSGNAGVEILGGSLAGITGPVNRNGKEMTWLRNSAGTMQMQLSGGNTYVSGGTWQGPMQLGEFRLWVDTGGRLRIKNGQPASDTDGTIVGTQA